MSEDINTTILRRLSNLETHIINLVIPLQEINDVLKSPQQIINLVSALNKPIAIDDGNLRSLLADFRNSMDEFRKMIEKLDVGQTYGEIKFIGSRLDKIEKSISEINTKGLNKEIELSFSCEGYQLVKKPIGYDKEDLIEDPNADLKKLLDSLTKREAKVLVHRYGLFAERVKTLEDVGHMLGISREPVRLLQDRALRKCRHPDRIELSKKIKKDKLRHDIFGE